MEKQQEAKPADSMDIDNANSTNNKDENSMDSSKSNEEQAQAQQRGIKKKNLRGLAKTEAEIVPNTTGKKQGFVAYAVTYGKPRFDFLRIF
jgi:hypothetical protein